MDSPQMTFDEWINKQLDLLEMERTAVWIVFFFVFCTLTNAK